MGVRGSSPLSSTREHLGVPLPRGTPGVVSGGGSGHEPLGGGYVGQGMLSSAAPGAFFSSPTPDQILAATQADDGGAGVLHLILNYTGDILNFEMAAELVAAEGGAQVETVVVDDDVAVQDSLYTAGRRGVGLTVLLEKLVGAAADEGRPLTEVAALARRINGAGRSMGMALTSCTVPAAGRPTFELPEGQMELGVGIHPVRHLLPGQHQGVSVGQGGDREEGDDVVVLPDEAARNLAVDDLGEQGTHA